MIELSTDEADELLEREDMTVFSSFDAHLAYATRYDETPLDSLVRAYYLYGSALGA